MMAQEESSLLFTVNLTLYNDKDVYATSLNDISKHVMHILKENICKDHT